ncbi:MAG: rhodanese-like domain-containing protein [Bacteroidales bacterium]|nr:rhodanese-like domain-containing protein [Bacteroidales bacterium]
MQEDFFSGKCFLSSGFNNLTPRDALSEAVSKDALILDVREPELIGAKRFDVPELIYLPFSRLNENISQVPADRPVIVADSAGLKSHDAIIMLIENGYKNIANLAGGIIEWERDGLPLSIDKREQLSGSCACQLKPRNRVRKKQ